MHVFLAMLSSHRNQAFRERPAARATATQAGMDACALSRLTRCKQAATGAESTVVVPFVTNKAPQPAIGCQGCHRNRLHAKLEHCSSASLMARCTAKDSPDIVS